MLTRGGVALALAEWWLSQPIVEVLYSARLTMLKHSLLVFIVMITACAKPQFVSGYPNDPDLRQKLGLSLREWEDIQDEFKAVEITRNVKPIFWARSRLADAVEVHCVNLNSPLPAKSGPVFFFAVYEGHWRLTREMSEWKENWKN